MCVCLDKTEAELLGVDHGFLGKQQPLAPAASRSGLPSVSAWLSVFSPDPQPPTACRSHNESGVGQGPHYHLRETGVIHSNSREQFVLTHPPSLLALASSLREGRGPSTPQRLVRMEAGRGLRKPRVAPQKTAIGMWTPAQIIYPHRALNTLPEIPPLNMQRFRVSAPRVRSLKSPFHPDK